MSPDQGYSIYLWPTSNNTLRDIAQMIKWSIVNRGQPCEITTHLNPNRTNIVIGAHHVLDQQIDEPLFEDTIIVNSEQLDEGSKWLTTDYIDMLKKYVVWDYNQSNLTWLKNHLSVEAHLFELGYTPDLKSVNSEPEELDVLFYSEGSERQRHIYDELIKRQVKVRFGDHDEQAKIVLNIHRDSSSLLEVYRALINEKFVISETAINQDEYQHLKSGFIICDYHSIIDTVMEYLSPEKDQERHDIAQRGYQLISKLPPKLPDYLTIPHIYIINLKSRPDRLDRMIQRMKYHGLHNNYTVIEAVTGYDRIVEDYYGQGLNLDISRVNDPSYGLVRFELACFASHLKALKRMIDDHRREAIILEDDAMLRNDFINTFSSVRENLPNDATLMMLYYYNLSQYGWVGKNPEKHNLLKMGNNWGAGGYWISDHYAEECLKQYDCPFVEVNGCLTSELITMGSNGYLGYPMLVIEEPLANSNLRDDISAHTEYSSKFGWDNFTAAENDSWKALLKGKNLYQQERHHDIYRVTYKVQLEKLSSYHQFLYLDLATISYWYANQKPTARRLAYKLQELALNDPIVRNEVKKHYDRIASNLAFYYDPSQYSKKIVIIGYPHMYGDWDPDSINDGLPGSEEAIVYGAQELANRGYRVVVYGKPPPKSMYSLALSNPLYRRIEHLNREQEVYDVAFLWRITEMSHLAKRHLIWLHDLSGGYNHFPTVTDQTCVLWLSEFHFQNYLSCNPLLATIPHKVFGNGFVPDQFRGVKAIKNKYSCIYASNYARGLSTLINIWPQVKARYPQATLDIYYGWETWGTYNDQQVTQLQHDVKTAELLDVREHGKIGHQELALRMLEASIWTYPCSYPETFCITAVKMQAAGCVPVIIESAALTETVKYGYRCQDQQDYLELLLKAMSEINQWDESKREEMHKWAINKYSWASIVDAWVKEF